MPTHFKTNCPGCSELLKINSKVTGTVGCGTCGEQLNVSENGDKLHIERNQEFTPAYDLSDSAISRLKPVEVNSLEEASKCTASGSYLASEIMATRALESISKRLTDKGNWSDAIGDLQEEYPRLTGTIEYLKDERNNVAHPDKVTSSKVEANQTYYMVIRMVEEILGEESGAKETV